MSWRIFSSACASSVAVFLDELAQRGGGGLAVADLLPLGLDFFAEPVREQNRVRRRFGEPRPGLGFASDFRLAGLGCFQCGGVAQLLFIEPHQPVQGGAPHPDILRRDARGRVGQAGLAERGTAGRELRPAGLPEIRRSPRAGAAE